MHKVIQVFSAVAAATCGFLWGQIDGLFYALVAFMILDYITGVLVAIAQHELSSKVGFKGICKKAVILVFVAVGHIVDEYVLHSDALCRSAVAGFYLANEGLSILENGHFLGLPLPKKLVAVLEQLKEINDKEE